ncbi:MAG: hypothetical protein ACRD1M_00725 [Terriglobales bacterium]
MSTGTLPHFIPSAHSALLESVIVETVEHHWAEVSQCQLRALVLAGSLARQEGSWVPGPRGPVLLGDAELLCILPDTAPLPRTSDMAVLLARIRDAVTQVGLTAEVSLSPARESYLRRLPPHIFGYELRQTGRVLWGDGGCLDQIPACTAADLPREDAWRLLANRIIELLPSLWPSRSAAPSAYPWVKLYLDMATSYLVFSGGYAPSYRERARRLQRAAAPGTWATPGLTRMVEICTAWKLDPSDPSARIPEADLRSRGLDHAKRLWCWELEQMTGAAPGTEKAELWRRWLQRQSWRSRLRGWASAVRHGGAVPRLAPHWLRLALHASPRHCIYEAGAGLAFDPSPQLCDCAALLPFPPAAVPRRPADLVPAVVESFHRLAHSSRA